MAHTTETKISNNVEIYKDGDKWKQDNIDKNYISKEYSIRHEGDIKDYTVTITNENKIDICYNEMFENRTDETEEKFETAQELLEKFEANPRVNGIVYAYYEDYKKMKDIIGAYAYRHGGRV